MIGETCEAATDTPGRWELRIGATVYATDDVPGKLRQVIVSPGTQRVIALLVGGGFAAPEYLIPIEAVQKADEEQIQLSWTMDEVRTRGQYDAAHFYSPARSLVGYAPGEAAVSLRGNAGTKPFTLAPIQVGLKVVALDGEVGHVSRVLVDAATDQISHFVIHQGLLFPQERLVPADWVSSITTEVITLAVPRSDLSALPEYRPDEELTAEIINVWMADPAVQAILTYSDVRATVHDSVAVLEGYVWSSAQRRRLEAMARSVPGVLGICNKIVADDELYEAVTRALAEDPRTWERDIRVQSYLGIIHLHGAVPDKETRAAAARVAAQVPEVKDVINLVEVTGHTGTEG